MNLWDKSPWIRQLTVLVVALFFCSCEDETSLLGFKNPNPKFSVQYVEIPLESSVLLVDSILTDNLSTQGVGSTPFNAIGQYTDPLFGTLKADTYLQVTPGSTSKIDESSVYDSVTFQMRINFYSYGFSGEQTMRFNVHELTDKTIDLDSGRNRYYYNSSVPYNPSPIGQASVFVNYDSLKKEFTKTLPTQDTVLVRGRLADGYGQHLFSIALTDAGGKLSDNSLFVQDVKGLIVKPADNNGILGVNPLTSLSKVTVHYHTLANGAVTDTLEKSFIFSGATYDPNFTNYTADRSATEFFGLTAPYQSFTPSSGIRGVQSASPLLTKLDLAPFYKFADTVGTVVINSAELVIQDVESNAGIYNHGQFMLKVLNENNQFVNASYATDVEAMAPYVHTGSTDAGTVFTAGLHYYVRADVKSSSNGQPATASLDYISDSNGYSGYLTLFAQDLVKFKELKGQPNAAKIRYLTLYPMNPGVSTSVNRTVFNADKIKLRIYYTRPSSSVKIN